MGEFRSWYSFIIFWLDVLDDVVFVIWCWLVVEKVAPPAEATIYDLALAWCRRNAKTGLPVDVALLVFCMLFVLASSSYANNAPKEVVVRDARFMTGLD